MHTDNRVSMVKKIILQPHTEHGIKAGVDKLRPKKLHYWFKPNQRMLAQKGVHACMHNSAADTSAVDSGYPYIAVQKNFKINSFGTSVGATTKRWGEFDSKNDFS